MPPLNLIGVLLVAVAIATWIYARHSRWNAAAILLLSLYFAYRSVVVLIDWGFFHRMTIERYHELAYSLPQTHLRNRWLGILTEQNPNDAWITQEIIVEVAPDTLIETGTRFGGSATLWATVLAQVNPTGRVITIDIEDNVEPGTRALQIVKERVEFILASSTDPAVVARLRRQVDGQKVMVILDSDHSRDHVLAELQAYAPMVSRGSYLIVQDTNVNGHPVRSDFGPGPMEALDAWLPDHPEFESDRERERLLFTMHPRGYLRRRP